ncbi:MAG: dethiobiotin synthase, partial [Planctomycetales bacterium]
MRYYPTRGLYITGTDTGVGKTFVACQIVRSLRDQGHSVGVYKPVESGTYRSDSEPVPADAKALFDAAGLPVRLEDVCPQTFKAPLAPHQAALAEGRQVDRSLLRDGLAKWHKRCDIVVVEGAGGLMSPLTQDDYNANLAQEFGYPLVIVAANQLGVINHTLQTLITAAAFDEGLAIAGVVLNQISPHPDASIASNREELQQRCGPPILANLP